MRETKLECQVKTQTAASLLRAIKSHHQKNLVLSQRNGKNGSADSKDFEKPQLIRDRIVVGLRDRKLSGKLQLDPKLTLELAIRQAKQSEMVKNNKAQFTMMIKLHQPTLIELEKLSLLNKKNTSPMASQTTKWRKMQQMWGSTPPKVQMSSKRF